MKKIHLIAAHGLSQEIGFKNQLLWHYPEDLKRFKLLTQGHVMVMGRKTFESLPGVLPGREHWVLTRDQQFTVEHDRVKVFYSFEDLLKALPDDKIYVIGGGEIYTLFLPYADILDLTIVKHSAKHADAFFPAYKQHFHLLFDNEQGELAFQTWKRNLDYHKPDYAI